MMDLYILDNGKMEFRMDMEFLLILVVKLIRVFFNKMYLNKLNLTNNLIFKSRKKYKIT